MGVYSQPSGIFPMIQELPNKLPEPLRDFQNRVDQALVNATGYSVTAYGAVGDGVADDTVPFIAAYVAAEAAGGGVVTAPQGTFLISAKLTFPEGVGFRGAGMDVTILKRKSTYTGDLIWTGAGTGALYGMALQDFTIDDNYPAAAVRTSGIPIIMQGTSVVIERVKIMNPGYQGISCAQGIDSTVKDCILLGNNQAVGGSIPSAAVGIWADTGTVHNLTIKRCKFNDWTTNAIYGGAINMVIDDCDFQNNHRQTSTGGGQIATGQATGSTTVMNCRIGTGGGAATLGIEVHNGAWTIINNKITGQQVYGIGLAGTPTRVVMSHNSVSGSGVADFNSVISNSLWEGTHNTPSSMNSIRFASGNVGIGMDPVNFLDLSLSQNAATSFAITNINTGTTAQAIVYAASDTARVDLRAHSSGRTLLRYGTAVGGYSELLATSGLGLMIGTTTNAIPIIFGSNNVEVARMTSSGTVGIGTGATVSARLHSLSTTEQLRLGYDASNYVPFTVSSSGDLTVAPTGGDLVLTGTQTISGRLGIGTSGVPNDFIQVKYTDATGAFTGLSIQNLSGGANAFAGFSIYDNASVYSIFAGFNNSTHEFRFNNIATTPSINFMLSSSSALLISTNLTISPTGDVIFNPAGKDILPTLNYDLNIGALSKKYLTLHAAELWVETLVAADTMATIGGRILVGPTTQLTSDLAAAATSIIVKHNQMASGDRVYMEANGKVEFMAITSAPSGTGPYTYTVTRNLDGSGANDWNAGDAVFNTGTTGDGFIDLYSFRGVKSSSQVGPTIVGNVRNSSTYNDWSEHWAIGNLNGLYGYAVDTYGIGLGKYIAGTPHITIDATNGYRTFAGLSTVVQQIDNSGNVTVGQVASSQSNVYITGGALQFRNNTTVWMELQSTGVIIIGQVAASQANTLISSGALSMRINTTSYFNIDTSGNVTMGNVATNQGNAYWNASNKRLEFRGSTNGTVVQAYVDTTGAIMAGGGVVKLNSDGIGITAGASKISTNTLKFYHTDGTSIRGSIWSTGADLAVDAEAVAGTTTRLSLRALAAASTTSYVQLLTFDSTPAVVNHVQVGGGGMIISSSAISDNPLAMLEVRGTGYFTNNLGIGTTTFGTSAAKVLALFTGTAPTTGPADTVQFYSSDDSAGNTIPSFYCEGSGVVATGQADSASSVRVKMRINGTVRTFLCI